ncbi:hypothetical protein AB4Y63_17650 [Leifsonia sp. YAF41]|uniref:ATP-dependent DNA ligase n=1 Tax=Leifsonia sp. YAF41 TaxID=3233086 RepID=UPI003F957B56
MASGPEWAFEVKWDSFRVQASVDGSEALLRSRNGNNLTPAFPELVGPLLNAVSVDRAILDGELVVLGPDGIPSFSHLQQRAGRNRAPRVGAGAHAHLMLFDVLSFDDVDTTTSPYDVRRQVLGQMVVERSLIHVPPAFDGAIDSALAAAAEWGLEGVVAKRRTSLYLPGKRSRDWVKAKLNLEHLAVVTGWRPGGNRSVAELTIAVPDATAGGFRYVGTLTGGWNKFDGSRLAEQLKQSVVGDGVAGPRIVIEVEFLEWTSDGRMRHPMWRRIRPDLRPGDVPEA